jgi:hypothetical protein
MNQFQFDDLTRSLANGVSRRGFLKLLATGIGSAVVASLQGCGLIEGATGGSGGPGPTSCLSLGEDCGYSSDCCSGQCITTILANGGSIRRCARVCKSDCTEHGDSQSPNTCFLGFLPCNDAMGSPTACCKNGYWFCDWDPGSCSGCINATVIEPLPNEKCCDAILSTWDSERYGYLQKYTYNLSGSNSAKAQLLKSCEDCDSCFVSEPVRQSRVKN